MLKELFTAALGMQNQQTKLEVTANNLANANTSGYKRSEAFERNLIDARANFYNTPGDLEQNDAPIGSYVDFSAGSFNQTESPLDVSIENKGFFVLQDDEGKKFLTRAGRFKFSEDGTITAMDGKTLLGKEGPINVFQEFMEEGTANMDVRSLEIKINEKGQVFANGKDVGSIPVVNVKNEESIQRISNSEFIATNWSDVEELDENDITLRQGWLEGSNVNVVNEMVEMIELQRMFEAGSKVIKTNDDTLSNSIRLGKYY